MPDNTIAQIKQKLMELHDGDEQQLSVVFSEKDRVIVEAPAGYGKTTTMISRIAYLFATEQIPNPKRILGLTFSVNAALKVKRDVAEKLPSLIRMQNNPRLIVEKAVITNYHGFCKMVLKKYGHLLNTILRKDVNDFSAIGDNEIQKTADINRLLSQDDYRIIDCIETDIKQAVFPKDYSDYNSLIIEKLLPKGYITHNAVILFTLEILLKFPEVRKFYQHFFSLMIVDEFQDTNIIAWELIKLLITEETKLLFLGDSLQRIYGFIGAIPDIIKMATEEYHMTAIPLTKNYRFNDNNGMLLLDKNIRRNAQYGFNTCIANEEVAPLKAFWGNSPQDEATQIVEKIKKIIESEPKEKIAILCRSRNKNFDLIEQLLNENSINYFYGVFKDDDPKYVAFHKDCFTKFSNRFGKNKRITVLSLQNFVDEIKNKYSDEEDVIYQSLTRLLEALIKKVSADYSALSVEDRYIYILDIFENRQLKQAMEYIDASIILTTVHGAKGLEWDYVFLPDLERWVFPGGSVCSKCLNKFSLCSMHKCKLPDKINDDFNNAVLDELSVFYVGVTRAKKQVFVSASKKRIKNSGDLTPSDFSCFVNLSGIKLVNAKE